MKGDIRVRSATSARSAKEWVQKLRRSNLQHNVRVRVYSCFHHICRVSDNSVVYLDTCWDTTTRKESTCARFATATLRWGTTWSPTCAHIQVCLGGFCSEETSLLTGKVISIFSGEKPFSCDVCNRAFAHRSDMNRHKLIHTGSLTIHPVTVYTRPVLERHVPNLNTFKLRASSSAQFQIQIHALQFLSCYTVQTCMHCSWVGLTSIFIDVNILARLQREDVWNCAHSECTLLTKDPSSLAVQQTSLAAAAQKA